jgi:hypothetical protein
MRDLHSPSPTPDVGDLLDVSDAFAEASANEIQQQQQQEIVNNFHQNGNGTEQKPNRPPPPARPPPARPSPPSSTPVQANNVIPTSNQNEDDLVDLFGSAQQKKKPPKPPAPKTKEDILSLFTAPSQPVQEQAKPDLLSDDIDFAAEHKQQQEQQQQQHQQEQEQIQQQQQTPPTNVAVVSPYVDEIEKVTEIPRAIVEPIVQEKVVTLPILNHQMTTSTSIPTITEDLAEDRPQSDFMDPPEDETIIVPQTKCEISSDHSPTESGITSGGIPASESGSVVNMALETHEEANPFAEQVPAITPVNEQLQFLTQKNVDYQHQRPTTPDPIVAQPELAPIFGDCSPSHVSVKPAKPPPPIRGSSVLTTTQQTVSAQQQQQQQNHHVSNPIVPAFQKSDEFDDFAAKFENTGQVKSTGNAFLDSLGITESSTSNDAWGSSNDAFGSASTTNVTASDGFGADEVGFDSWDPPAVPESTPYAQRRMSSESNDGKDFSVTIKPRADYDYANVTAPALAPPMQKSPFGSVYSEGKNDDFFISIIL